MALPRRSKPRLGLLIHWVFILDDERHTQKGGGGGGTSVATIITS